eukprot:1035016_1
MLALGGVVMYCDYLEQEELEAMFNMSYVVDRKSYKSTNSLRSSAIIDVREEDFDLGGHIIGAVNIHYKYIEEEWTEFLLQYHMIHCIIFHCMHSEIRGPAAYHRYMELKASVIRKYNQTQKDSIVIEKKLKFHSLTTSIITKLSEQKCVVLEGGFSGWSRYCTTKKQSQWIGNTK